MHKRWEPENQGESPHLNQTILAPEILAFRYVRNEFQWFTPPTLETRTYTSSQMGKWDVLQSYIAKLMNVKLCYKEGQKELRSIIHLPVSNNSFTV